MCACVGVVGSCVFGRAACGWCGRWPPPVCVRLGAGRVSVLWLGVRCVAGWPPPPVCVCRVAGVLGVAGWPPPPVCVCVGPRVWVPRLSLRRKGRIRRGNYARDNSFSGVYDGMLHTMHNITRRKVRIIRVDPEKGFCGGPFQ